MAESSTIQPAPGDGAFLSRPQPGDGAFLSSSQSTLNGNAREWRQPPPHSRRGGRPHSHSRHGNGNVNTHGQAPAQTERLPTQMNGLRIAPPSLPLKPEGGVTIVEPHPLRSNDGPLRPSHPPGEDAAGNSSLGTAPKKSRKRAPRVRDGNPKLDPAAVSFTPNSNSALTSSSPSLPTTPNINQSAEPSTSPPHASGATAQHPPKATKPKSKNPPNQKPKEVSARRALFEKGSRLTNEDSPRPRMTVDRKEMNKREEKALVEADDLTSRLSRGLRTKPFLECPICFNAITPSQQIWSCLPPHHPPPPPPPSTYLQPPLLPPTTPGTPNPEQDKTRSNHYSACYTPFHLSCIRDWANRSLVEDLERARNAGRGDEGEGEWRCPGCQKRREGKVGGYRCFCGRNSQPATSTTAPHSCGDACSRPRAGCEHACPLNCHPGPCPPCQVALILPCPSHQNPLTIKCSSSSTPLSSLFSTTHQSPVCDSICDKPRKCGKGDHRCKLPCHYGDCGVCEEQEEVKCCCGEEVMVAGCGWGLENEQICVTINKVEDDVNGTGDSDVTDEAEIVEGKLESWKGRFCCEKPCERMYDCGVHACKSTCHPHPLVPLTCPKSPTLITSCPCGQTPLQSLPNYPRPNCLARIPTCQKACPKTRPCGHACPKTCHEGDCPPCHEQIVRACRCGEGVLVVACDEVREREERGEGEVVCERVCKALRNCGRHECGRLCCPLAYKAKNKKKNRADDDVDDEAHVCPLTCGKLLSCGLHSCPKPDHKGACGKCLQASYDELICNCGNTIVYPPVACGTTINCVYTCNRPPPSCGHPKTPHTCHESLLCPPCPYLTTKPCLCGKDPSVKNVRCSQERVSCGQVCGKALKCGYHTCEKGCHKPSDGCEDCSQTCRKPRKCGHGCTLPCHAPSKCPETDPCQTIVTQQCSCGHLQQRTSCGASNTNPSTREKVTLKCNSECLLRQRNARLADALGIVPSERGLEEWSDELKGFAVGNHAFVKTVESTFKDFFASTRQTMVLPHMPPAKRTFVLALADIYRLGKDLVDSEPNRSVQIRRRIDTRIPNPLLSVAAPPAVAKPSLGGLTSMKSKTVGSGAGVGRGWGAVGGTTTLPSSGAWGAGSG